MCLMMGVFLEMCFSHVYGEYSKHLGKLRWGTHLCVRCRMENTVDVLKSMSQVVVSLTDRQALCSFTRFKVAQGPVWQPELGKMSHVFVMLNRVKESNWVGKREWQCLLCLRALCSHFAGPIVH